MNLQFRELLLARRRKHVAMFQADALNRIEQLYGLGNTGVAVNHVYAIIPHTDDPVEASAYQEWLHSIGGALSEPTQDDLSFLRTRKL